MSSWSRSQIDPLSHPQTPSGGARRPGTRLACPFSHPLRKRVIHFLTWVKYICIQKVKENKHDSNLVFKSSKDGRWQLWRGKGTELALHVRLATLYLKDNHLKQSAHATFDLCALFHSKSRPQWATWIMSYLCVSISHFFTNKVTTQMQLPLSDHHTNEEYIHTSWACPCSQTFLT